MSLKNLSVKLESKYISPASNEKRIYKNKPAGEFPHINDEDGLWSYVAKQSRISERGDRLQQVVDGGLIHSTMFPDLCTRRVALHRMTGVPVRPQNPDYNSYIMWDAGRTAEDRNRSSLIKAVGREAIVGQWKCKCKNNPVIITHNYDSSKKGEYVECKHCNHYPDDYHELPVYLPEYHACCNPDLTYFNKYNQLIPWELKTIKEKTSGQLQGFKDLEKSQVGNKQQALMQNLFMKKAGYDQGDYVIVNYTSKAHTGFSLKPWKEFRENIADNKKLYQVNEKLLEKGLVIKSMGVDGRVSGEYDSGHGLPEGINVKKVCKECQMKAMCFSLKGGTKEMKFHADSSPNAKFHDK